MAKVKREVDPSPPPPLLRQKRLKSNLSNVLGDKENSDLSHQVSSRFSSNSNPTSINATFTQLQTELTGLRRQQQQDRIHFQSALDAQNGVIEALKASQDTYDRSPKSSGPLAENPNVDGGGLRNNVWGADEFNLYGATPPPPSIRTRTYELRQLFDRDKIWLADSANETWMILHDTKSMILKLLDERKRPVHNFQCKPLDFFEWNKESSRVILHRSSATHLCMELSTSGQCERFVKEVASSYKLEAILKDLKYIDKVFDSIKAKIDPRDSPPKQSTNTPYRSLGEPFPLFIRAGASSGFRYYGTYKEPYYSDSIGHNEMALLPKSVQYHWAKALGTPGMNGKSLKAITALRDMWSKVNIGWWNADTKEMIDYDQDLEEEHGELNVVKRHITEEEAEAITPDQIMAAFNAPETGNQPAARLFYEYLQCVSYDKSFYGQLVARKHHDET